MDLVLGPGILEQLIQHAKVAYPVEGCGLLAGRDVAGRFIAMRNVSGSSAEYEMDPAELIHVLRELRNSGEQLLAIYHSHPHGPAGLSDKDVEQAYYPEAAQVVVSLADPEHPQAMAFRITGGAIRQIELHVIV
ncbi:MAG TPA: M67 family metallopeptidase [Terriglobia bacterium]|jgi:proteasome lid subunit RPN8/RPN11